MPTRYDVSSVPMQGGYIAKQCPARAQLDVLQPVQPRPVGPVLQRRFDRGVLFEAHIVAALVSAHAGVTVIEGEEAELRERATVAAMVRGVPLILNARLPGDPIGRRVGKPDLLVLAPDGGYRPVDIKHHRTIEPGELPARTSSLERPSLEDAFDEEERTAREHKGDLLQLAHYQRMLEAAGVAASDGRWGGIIGVERCIVWHDLDVPRWRTPSSTGKQKVRSVMEVYDFEFDFRLDIMAVAEPHKNDSAVELLVIPFRKSECDECPWWDWCRPQLEAGSGHPSLIPRLTWPQWEVYRDRGILDRAGIAALDHATARLVGAGVDLATLLAEAQALHDDVELSSSTSLARRPKQKAILEAAGIENVGALKALDPLTASYAGTGMSALPEHIDRALAALGSEPVYRRRGIASVTVPRADVEVDVDMENVEDGVYLWGVLADGRYRPFVTWAPLTTEVEADVFGEFWRWMMELRDKTVSTGRTFRAYCWHEQAENSQMRRIGATLGIGEDVEAFIASEEWVDLRRVFDTQLITGAGSGLKLIAPMAGFEWPVEDPGGGESMVRYDEAMAGDEGARAWLLDYNRGDVEATCRLRMWIWERGSSFEPVEAAR